MDDRWLSVDEITEYLGVSRDTIYNWIAARGMPAHRVGRLWKFKKEAVDAWVQSGGADTADSSTSDEEPVRPNEQALPDSEAKKTRTKKRGGTGE